MKMRYKIVCLFFIWIVTLPMGWVCYPFYGPIDFAMLMGYERWETYSELSRHIFGYGALGYFFGWITLPFALIDEPAQHFIRGKEFSLLQWITNIISTIVGIGLSRFIKTSFRNPWIGRKRN